MHVIPKGIGARKSALELIRNWGVPTTPDLMSRIVI